CRIHDRWEAERTTSMNRSIAAGSLVDRASRYTLRIGLPDGLKPPAVAYVVIDHISGLPDFMRRGLTWDQGAEMADHASITVAASLPIYFAHPRSPWERPTNENTNRLIREYLPKGTVIPSAQAY